MNWPDVYTALCCFRACTSQLLQSLLEADALSRGADPSHSLAECESLSTFSFDASVRMSRCQGHGEMGVCREEAPSTKGGEGTGFLPTLAGTSTGHRDSTIFLNRKVNSMLEK